MRSCCLACATAVACLPWQCCAFILPGTTQQPRSAAITSGSGSSRCCGAVHARTAASDRGSAGRLQAAAGEDEGELGLGQELQEGPVVVETEEELWAETGRKGRVLKRKKDLPSPDYTPQQVCDRVLRALQLNDDPMLDYGAAVMVKFASPANAASQLLPTQYGGYLRSSPEYEVLLENSRFGLTGPLQMADSGKRCVQRVTVMGPPPALSRVEFDVQLSKVDVPGRGECWLIDAVAPASG